MSAKRKPMKPRRAWGRVDAEGRVYQVRFYREQLDAMHGDSIRRVEVREVRRRRKR